MTTKEHIELLHQRLRTVQSAMNEALDVAHSTRDIQDLSVRDTRFLRESVIDLQLINKRLASDLFAVQNRLSRINNQENG